MLVAATVDSLKHHPSACSKVVELSDFTNGWIFGELQPFEAGLSVVREYFTGKGRAAAEKYFWKHSVAAYRWIRRDPGQPQA